MASRHESRRRAIEVLYQSHVTGTDPRAVVDQWLSAGREVDPFAERLIDGVAEHRIELDGLLASHSEHWPLDRMASVDRVVLRLAAFELSYGEVPPAVAIDEAVRLAKELSTEDSGAFVNGILGRIAAERRAG